MRIEYDPILVAMSVAIAIFGSFTALALTSNHDRGTSATGYAGCLPCYGGIIVGGSIWSMHFVAMLAVQLPIVISYDLGTTLLSLILPIIVTGISLNIVVRRWAGRASIPLAGVLMGLAIASMHYLGMGAIRGCGLSHDPGGVTLATFIAIAAATIALWFVFRRRRPIETVLGAVVLGFAIAGMHYTAMLFTAFAPMKAQPEQLVPTLASDTLAYLIGGAVLLICTANMIIVPRASMLQHGK